MGRFKIQWSNKKSLISHRKTVWMTPVRVEIYVCEENKNGTGTRLKHTVPDRVHFTNWILFSCLKISSVQYARIYLSCCLPLFQYIKLSEYLLFYKKICSVNIIQNNSEYQSNFYHWVVYREVFLVQHPPAILDRSIVEKENTFKSKPILTLCPKPRW